MLRMPTSSWRFSARALPGPGIALAVLLPVSLAAGDTRDSPTPSAEERASLFKSEGVRWIQRERDRHYSHARPLGPEDRRFFAAYFPERILDGVRVRTVERFENPEFFSLFELAGEPYPVDLRRASGMALIDTILLASHASRGPLRRRICFTSSSTWFSTTFSASRSI